MDSILIFSPILEWLEEYDLSLHFTLQEVLIWETVDRKDLLVVSEYDKKEDGFLLEFILQEVFITGTADKTHDVELLTTVLPWTPVELAKQYLILLLETVKFVGKYFLTDIEIEIESWLEDLEIKVCSVSFNFRKLSR